MNQRQRKYIIFFAFSLSFYVIIDFRLTIVQIWLKTKSCITFIRRAGLFLRLHKAIVIDYTSA